MATKGSSEVIKSSTEQDNVRRNAKRGKRKSKNRHGETYFEGLQADRLKREASALIDRLNPVMCSSSPTAHVVIRDAFVVLAKTFADTPEHKLQQARVRRLDYSLDVALRDVREPRVAAHIRHSAIQAHRAIRRSNAQSAAA